ncbi:hypothetical protein SSX86_006347 [Deinandra increscens subsp. villosa]|uniref:DUF569 domain-containing protein n=1 Tax=Deinandra increscens subsp. villosa TaxID=3103831 RepID=A0AAP0H3N6_9ASTR
MVADDDEQSVSQDRDGSTEKAEWEVFPTGEKYLRFKSCYGKYLMASNNPFLQGVKGKKVIQTELKPDLDGSVNWEPLRDGFQVGVVSKSAAVQMAEDAELDLVIVSPEAEPPVVKLMDYK